jgi:hypothetical protein
MMVVNIHATCVRIGRHAVLLLGPSGAGKSDLALRLIDEGARLVSDDRVLLSVRKGALLAAAPPTIRGLLEMRGVGIVAVKAAPPTPVALAVRLGREGARLPAPRAWRLPAGLTKAAPVPLIALNPRFAATPAKIRAALAAFSQGGLRDTFNLK